jgi:hypothetical protein
VNQKLIFFNNRAQDDNYSSFLLRAGAKPTAWQPMILNRNAWLSAKFNKKTTC